MQSERPAVLIDPVCGMRVAVDAAEADGLLVELDGRTWAFCRAACRDTFVTDPAAHVARAELAEAAATDALAGDGPERTAAVARPLPDIDEGFRRWYESCACCLSDAYPEIKARLDAEHAASHQQPVPEGICATAEAAEAAVAAAAAAGPTD